MQDGKYDTLSNAAIATESGAITFCGPMSLLGKKPEELAKVVYDLKQSFITPGLIDCHTHLVFGGNRSQEFKQRLEGASYEQIARQGGGILSTVRQTREASEDALYEAALKRAQTLMKEGVCALEIKSGYGLDLETETKMLVVATRIRDILNIPVQRTFLGAHALPEEYKNNADGYIDMVCSQMLPELADNGLIDAVDGFCENIAFNKEQIARVFDKASALGLPVKLHAEQISFMGGASLATDYKALSADHLEYIDEDSVIKMAGAGTIAVLLPGAFYFLRETKTPPIDLFRKHGVKMALATDLNPGSSPVNSLLLIMNMACTLFRMTPEEALRAVTRNAASALGYNDLGVLKEGNRGNFAIWDIEDINELAYYLGRNPCSGLVVEGAYVFSPQ
jgi:imidazolonepropionase